MVLRWLLTRLVVLSTLSQGATYPVGSRRSLPLWLLFCTVVADDGNDQVVQRVALLPAEPLRFVRRFPWTVFGLGDVCELANPLLVDSQGIRDGLNGLRTRAALGDEPGDGSGPDAGGLGDPAMGGTDTGLLRELLPLGRQRGTCHVYELSQARCCSVQRVGRHAVYKLACSSRLTCT